eukprot:4251143-Ditylum_brightwellii.AAC.1
MTPFRLSQIQHNKIQPPSFYIFTHFQNMSNQGEVHIATDGSVAGKKGYFTVVFHTEHEMLRFQGPCNGSPVLAQLPLYCDNAAAVLTANLPTHPSLKAHSCADYNIVAEAHQDKETPIANLTLDAMLNCTVDKGAENFRLTASTELQPKL